MQLKPVLLPPVVVALSLAVVWSVFGPVAAQDKKDSPVRPASAISRPPEAQNPALKERLAEVLQDLNRNAKSIEICDLKLTRYTYFPENPFPTRPDAIIQKLESDGARKDLASLTKVLKELIAVWPESGDLGERLKIDFAMSGKKTGWRVVKPNGEHQIHTIFDGELWLGDSGQQVTIREKGTIVTDTLATYRYLPADLAARVKPLRDLELIGGNLVIKDGNNEYRFNKAGHCTSYTNRSDGKVSRQVFQYYHNAKWEEFALPTVRIDIDYTTENGGGLGSLIACFVADANFNKKVPPETFVMPVAVGRKFNDERRVPFRNVVIVKTANPDARQYAMLPEANPIEP